MFGGRFLLHGVLFDRRHIPIPALLLLRLPEAVLIETAKYSSDQQIVLSFR